MTYALPAYEVRLIVVPAVALAAITFIVVLAVGTVVLRRRDAREDDDADEYMAPLRTGGTGTERRMRGVFRDRGMMPARRTSPARKTAHPAPATGAGRHRRPPQPPPAAAQPSVPAPATELPPAPLPKEPDLPAYTDDSTTWQTLVLIYGGK